MLLIGIGSVIFIIINANHYWGANRSSFIRVNTGNFTPYGGIRDTNATKSVLKEKLLEYWSSLPLSDGTKCCSVKDPRIILASLWQHKRIQEVNDFLSKQKPNGSTGSTWTFYHYGNYDFTLMLLTPVLYFFGDTPNLLYPKTRKHLLSVLLTAQGGHYVNSVPRTFGLIQDTENHLLMINGSMYLKNEWLWRHGVRKKEFDNRTNGMRNKLLNYLLEIYHYGIYEFNAQPYQGYTISALLNLQAFADDSIRTMAGKILDRLCWEYSYGSDFFRRYPPIRRRYDRGQIENKSLTGDYLGAMMKVWADFYDDKLQVSVKKGKHIAFWAAIMPYRPPKKAMALAMVKKEFYYVKIGHGAFSCPEIYSVDKHYFLSAGGANMGDRSLIIARPIVLITDTSSNKLDEVIHLSGPGRYFKHWNDTGVYKNFACAAGPVYVPKNKIPIVSENDWRIFTITINEYLAIYSDSSLGILAICRNQNPVNLLHTILRNNPDNKALMTEFHHPDGDVIKYNLHAPHDKWVITNINGKNVNRNFDEWPFFDLSK